MSGGRYCPMSIGGYMLWQYYCQTLLTFLLLTFRSIVTVEVSWYFCHLFFLFFDSLTIYLSWAPTPAFSELLTFFLVLTNVTNWVFSDKVPFSNLSPQLVSCTRVVMSRPTHGAVPVARNMLYPSQQNPGDPPVPARYPHTRVDTINWAIKRTLRLLTLETLGGNSLIRMKL